jgi:hypothetical protein
MRALSIKQPWAWLIVHGYKDIENRNWKLPALNFPLPQHIYVHASKEFDYDSWCDIGSGLVPGASSCQLAVHERFYAGNGNYLLGAIVGEVDIIDCVTESKSLWFVGKYGFVLANPIAYVKPIPYKGRLGFFDISLK